MPCRRLSSTTFEIPDRDVGNAINLTPGVGWVRGNQALDPKLLQDSERMRMENESCESNLRTNMRREFRLMKR